MKSKQRKFRENNHGVIFSPENIVPRPPLSKVVGYFFSWEDAETILYAKVIGVKLNNDGHYTKVMKVQFFNCNEDKVEIDDNVETFAYGCPSGLTTWYKVVMPN